jgi:hypothetical protein
VSVLSNYSHFFNFRDGATALGIMTPSMAPELLYQTDNFYCNAGCSGVAGQNDDYKLAMKQLFLY